jgi:hypothetical protein
MTIQLHSGKNVQVDSFNFSYTYADLLEGEPDEEYNEEIFEDAYYPSSWGSRKLLKIQPSSEEFETRLKPCMYSVYLVSNDPIVESNDGSELVVLWFGENPNDRPIKDIIETGVKEIDWEKNAQDIEY